MKCILVVAALLATAYGGENIALGKATFQSSEMYKGSPGRAVDGNEDSDYTKSTCTHTDYEAKPFWGVDLGMKYAINTVEIVNRADCCANRLHNFDIIVTNTRPSSKSTLYKRSELCHRQVETFNGQKLFRCSKLMVGRYVIIRFYDNEKRALTLCEVKIEGKTGNGIFCHRDNSDCIKHDVDVIKGATLETCQQTCYNRDDCMSIQYNNKQECYIKNYACTDKELLSNSAGNDYIMVENADQCPIAFEYCSRTKSDCPGHDIAQYRGLNRAQCQMRCSISRNCRSATHDGDRCYLKDFACAHFEIVGHQSAEDHIRVNDKSECEYLWNIFD